MDKMDNLKISFNNLTAQRTGDRNQFVSLASKDLSISKDANIALGNLKLSKPTINILDSKNNLKIDARNLSLDVNKFNLNNKDTIIIVIFRPIL